MRTELIVAAVVGGLATYLIRLLPMLAGERLSARMASPRLRRFLLALGPAAIVALLVLALGDLIPAAEARRPAAILALGLGAVVVVATQRLTRNPALATLAGAVAVGLFHALEIS
ncbi:MAG: AzlD domain-containing protein [Bacteroidota bacterium]